MVGLSGHTGLLGSAVKECLINRGRSIVCFGRNNSDVYWDLNAPASIAREDASVDFFIHCAANINIEWCESNPEESYIMHVEAVKHLAEYCRKNESHLILISSDYVFSGSNNPYIESAEADPINIYGKHKLEAEKYLQEFRPCQFSIVRPTILYGMSSSGARDFVGNILRGEVSRLDDRRVKYPLWNEDLAEIICSLIEMNECPEVVHVSPKQGLTKFDMYLEIKKVLPNHTPLVQAFDESEFHRVERPKEVQLASTVTMDVDVKEFFEVSEILAERVLGV
ncbi:MAG: hypothetical protein CL677_08580 [Bdellovibrionaceae bacterium]|nr:hypothetical protein [Pseudobdellovibrionaceae bacterium]|tara:strand:+ start:80361 stop:81203 length:843 start_codon:yes stop_codon:yes gene_type:complete